MKIASLELKCVILILLSSNLWTLIIAIGSDDDHAEILNKLKNDFRDVRHTNQYAVLYVPPPNAPRGRVQYVPRTPQISPGTVIVPEVDNSNRNRYPQNYAGSTVDLNGAEYGNMMHRARGRTIHTEDLSLNLVYPGMQNWYNEHFRGRTISAAYLYTHFLPCPRCFDIIRNFVQTTGIRLYVGYTDLFGGMREGGNPNLERDTRQRRNNIQNFLNDNRGLLLQVADRGICHQPGIGGRIGRDISDICKTTVEMLVIAMDFTSGKAQVWFNGFNPDYYGWVALLDKNNKRLTWEYTNSKTTGKITFNQYIQNGAYIQYWPNYKRTIRQSYPWKDCGFEFIKLHKLPYTVQTPAIFAEIKLTMMGAYAAVLIKKSRYYTPNSYDWVMIQTLAQIDSKSYQTWNWVSKFTHESDYFYYQFSLGSQFADGFRAKYVFYDGTKYRYEGIYDNASPIWTPGGCQGGSY